MAGQHDQDSRLKRALEQWREERLVEIECEIAEQNYLYGRAGFGLKCAHETPGVLDEQFIESLWDEMNSAAVELARLEKESEQLRTMELAALIVKFKQWAARRRQKVETTEAATGKNDSDQADHQTQDPTSSGQPAQENSNDQVERILTAWREIMGMELDQKRVEQHLKALDAWQQKWRKRREEEDGN